MSANSDDQNYSLSHPELEFLSDEKLSDLNGRQKQVYANKRNRYIQYLRERGKVPIKNIGYSEGSVKSTQRLVQQVFDWIWEEEITTQLTTEHADEFVEALRTDEFRKNDGERYSGGSKRKFADALTSWFRWQEVDWEPNIRFRSEGPRDGADPFSMAESDRLFEAALQYKTIPSYNNLSSDERDRWKSYLAQELGKPKTEIKPEDWGRQNRCLKFPTMVQITRKYGLRATLTGKLLTSWYDESAKTIRIPQEEALKNNTSWDLELPESDADLLEDWLAQRQNISKYDGKAEIWLNREGNRYNSKTLNNLLNDLMEEANIDQSGRNLVWHSFRHTVGTYTYYEYKDLKMVAEMLRQKTKTSAEVYVHTPPELKREAASKLSNSVISPQG